MNLLQPILVLLVAYVAVFLEASFGGFRHWFGAQIDLLPALMVYAGMTCDLVTIALLAVLGGLCFDSLSTNSLGVTMLPLLLVGLLIYSRRGLILRDQLFAQLVLGFSASALAPLLTLLLVLSTRETPLLGWGSLWQWVVMSVGGALFTPVFFHLFDGLNHALSYRPVSESSFRSDREIRRGRS